MNFISQYDRELIRIVTRKSRLALLAGLVRRKPLTRWQRMKCKTRLFRQRFADAWAVLRGTAEVGE